MQNTSNKRLAKPLQRLARTLLATTCLTCATGGVAFSSIITEGTSPAPSDFPNVTPGFALPAGTTKVNGSISPTDIDFFEFTGLVGGGTFSLTATATGGNTYANNIAVLSDTGTTIAPTPCCASFFSGFPVTFSSQLIPADGNIVVQISPSEGGGAYTIDLTAPVATPEPSTLGVVGLVLASALGIRRKRTR